jgi:hypothetical protein
MRARLGGVQLDVSPVGSERLVTPPGAVERRRQIELRTWRMRVHPDGVAAHGDGAVRR